MKTAALDHTPRTKLVCPHPWKNGAAPHRHLQGEVWRFNRTFTVLPFLRLGDLMHAGGRTGLVLKRLTATSTAPASAGAIRGRDADVSGWRGLARLQLMRARIGSVSCWRPRVWERACIAYCPSGRAVLHLQGE
jgi:hypothetical protein